MDNSFAFVIFGITGNLSSGMLIPALYDIAEKELLPENIHIIGNARKPMSSEEIREYIKKVLEQENRHHKHPIKPAVFESLVSKISYIDGHLDSPDFYIKLKQFLSSYSNKIFYLATYPELYPDIFENLNKTGLNTEDRGWVRLLIEKPFGYDLESARSLNQLLHKYFKEDQIYRIDHYLGKETLQNILTFRFSNGIFEPVINQDYVDHIQVTLAEDFGIGQRGGFYDKVGALKDVGQNHLLQMLTFATMDTPPEFSNDAITRERIKILKSLVPMPEKIIFGQYEGYKNEPNVDPNSKTDTFFAFKTEIDNDRFKGVPIYIRSGKNLAETVAEISIVFKTPIKRIFKHLESGEEPNVLIYRIQPNEGIVLRFLTKKPGPEVELESTYMQYCYPQKGDTHALPDPHEKLILDAIRGDQTFFNEAEEVEAQWAFIDPLAQRKSEPIIYEPGSWGPKEADKLLEEDGKSWLEPSMQFCSI